MGMKNNAKGVEVQIAGKLRGQRTKTVKYSKGHMIKSGEAVKYYVQKSVKHVPLKQGVIGVRVKIQLPQDEAGRNGPKIALPDTVKFIDLQYDCDRKTRIAEMEKDRIQEQQEKAQYNNDGVVIPQNQ